MKRFTHKKHKNSSSISTVVNYKWRTKYFYLHCDVCGVRHPDVCVNGLCEEEGFPEGDFCWNCQMSMISQGFVNVSTK